MTKGHDEGFSDPPTVAWPLQQGTSDLLQENLPNSENFLAIGFFC